MGRWGWYTAFPYINALLGQVISRATTSLASAHLLVFSDVFLRRIALEIVELRRGEGLSCGKAYSPANVAT